MGKEFASPLEEARESCPHPEETRFRLLAPEEGSFPCVVVKEFPVSRRISRGGAISLNESMTTDAAHLKKKLFSKPYLEISIYISLAIIESHGQPGIVSSFSS